MSENEIFDKQIRLIVTIIVMIFDLIASAMWCHMYYSGFHTGWWVIVLIFLSLIFGLLSMMKAIRLVRELSKYEN